MAKVFIPLPLQRLTQGNSQLEIEANDVIGVISKLEKKFPGVEKLIAPGKKVQPFINIYINGKDIRFLEGESTVVKDFDEVNIVLAVSGG